MKATNPLAQATVALSLVIAVTGCLLVVSKAIGASHVVFAYLVPTMLVAMLCEPIIASLTSLAGTLSAAFFFYAPKFSLYVADPKQAAELVAFTVFAMIASRALGIVWRERKTAGLLTQTATATERPDHIRRERGRFSSAHSAARSFGTQTGAPDAWTTEDRLPTD